MGSREKERKRRGGWGFQCKIPFSRAINAAKINEIGILIKGG